MRPIMFDVDGVLADFVLGFLQVVNALPKGKGIIPYSTHEQKVWDFALPPKLLHAAWDIVKAERHFWADLPALISPAVFKDINRLRRYREVYFVTNRVGHKAHEQTREWLVTHGIEHPAVVVTGRKGQFAAAINAAAAIDDKAGNAVYTAYESPTTESFIIDLPYNHFDGGVLGSKVTRVDSVDQFLQAIEEGHI
jgi:hypothetical protein